MIFKSLHENNGWILVEYSATWKYGYDFMLDAAQCIMDMDFKEGLQRVATADIAGAKDIERIEEVLKARNILRNCDSLRKEWGVLTVSGISTIMECPVQFSFFNQTDLVKLFCPIKKYFEDHGEHVFDNYLNSIEIKAYCKDTERRVRDEKRLRWNRRI